MPGSNFQLQSDLIDFSLLKKYNDNFKYILVTIDVFSKVAFAVCLKTKSSKDMIQAFEKVLAHRKPFQKLQTDMGSEFLNKPFQRWLQQKHIEHFYTYNTDTKASIAERFIRTLKEKLWRFFTYTNTRRYVEVLPILVEAYNNTYHSSIKMAPNSVTSQNQEQVWHNLYEEQPPKTPKLKENDLVRISMVRMQFRKSYLPGWTEELFQIAKAFSGDPPYYQVKDLSGDILKGTFYEEELQQIFKNDNIFKIERIVKSRRRGKQRFFLVKWLGYPESANSWVKQQDLLPR